MLSRVGCLRVGRLVGRAGVLDVFALLFQLPLLACVPQVAAAQRLPLLACVPQPVSCRFPIGCLRGASRFAIECLMIAPLDS